MRRSAVFLVLALSGVLCHSAAVAGRAAQQPDQVAFVRDRAGNSDIFLIDVATGHETNLTDHPAQDDGPAWEPDDGNQLVFASTRAGTWDLWVMDVTTRAIRQLTDDPGAEFDPAWSFSGDTIAYESSLNGRRELRSVSASGGTPSQVTPPAGLDLDPAFLPDGAIAFDSDRSGGFDLWSVRGGQVERMVGGRPADFHATVAENGELAFERVVDGNFDIFVVDPGSSAEPSRLTSGRAEHSEPTWAPGERRLAYVSADDGDYDIVVHDLETREKRRVTRNNAQDTAPAWRPEAEVVTPVAVGTALRLSLSCPTRGILKPTPRDDELHGGTVGNTICGGLGDDGLYGKGGTDHLCGEGGRDRMLGGPGNDRLYGGNDSCGAGPDRLRGGNGNDRVFARGDSRRDCAWGGPGGNDRGRLFLGKGPTGDSIGKAPWGRGECGSRKSFEALE